MDSTIPPSVFDNAYESGRPPWVIGEPQPAIVELERNGWIRGSVLDIGCGTGEHTILLAELGYDVLGVDSSRLAVERARANAVSRGVAARFEVADALACSDGPEFDTVVDSALFHIFGPDERAAYVRSLYAACRLGGVVHVLALSDEGPGVGPQVSDDAIIEAFDDGWTLEDLSATTYRVILNAEHAARHNVPADVPLDVVAHLARVRRR